MQVPARITYRLESDHSIIEETDAVLPVPVDDGIINGILEESLMTGRSSEENEVSL
jgi:hypothetical protein